MRIHVNVRWKLNLLRLPTVSDTYVVSDPCITTKHEFGTNSARTQHELSNMDNFAAFIGSRKEDFWLIQRQTNREERKIGRWGTYREGWRHLRTLVNIVVDKKRQEKQTNKMGHETKSNNHVPSGTTVRNNHVNTVLDVWKGKWQRKTQTKETKERKYNKLDACVWSIEPEETFGWIGG